MPIYLYRAEGKKRCSYCRRGFEVLQKLADASLNACPKCGGAVRKVIGGFSIGFSKTHLDRRAKEKGFHKLKKVDKGKYEKMY